MLSHTRVKFLRSLHIKKYRNASNQFIVEGEKLVLETLKIHKRLNISLVEILALPAWIETHNHLLDRSKVTLTSISDKQLHQISSQKTPNMAVALMQINHDQPAQAPKSDELILAFDRLQDPGNFGTIVRTADWFGVDRIVLSKGSVDPLNQKVIQASMGSIFRIPVFESDLKPWIQSGGPGIRVFGAVLEGESSYTDSIQKPGILLMGNESAGIQENLRSTITHPVGITKYSHSEPSAESLNVAIATGILLYEINRPIAG